MTDGLGAVIGRLAINNIEFFQLNTMGKLAVLEYDETNDQNHKTSANNDGVLTRKGNKNGSSSSTRNKVSNSDIIVEEFIPMVEKRHCISISPGKQEVAWRTYIKGESRICTH